MTKEDLWAQYVAKNPQFKGARPVTMTTVGLRKLFDQTWDQAEKHAQDVSTAGADMFEKMFGKRK